MSTLAAVVIAALPKCPLCSMALMSALGMGSTINSTWSQPLAVALLFLSVGALFVRARRWRRYAPFCLGLVAAIVIYSCKFKFNYNVGVYFGGAALLAASIWNAVPGRRAADNNRCHC